MREKINQEIGVITVFSARLKAAAPYLLHWHNNDYQVGEIGYHHTIKRGETLHHIFEVTDKDSSMCFRLRLDTSNLHWTLEAISDGLAT
ncbi:MAG TPA: hypothetical protein VJC09_02370 [Candidatus Saccharimonadales bacterium]|nr:hypothetical protein [Candidatus Saccharimonadales bacterium]